MPRLRRLSSDELVRILRRSRFGVTARRGSHAKLVRVAADGERQIVTIPLHKHLATGALHAVYRRTARFVPSVALRRAFFTD